MTNVSRRTVLANTGPAVAAAALVGSIPTATLAAAGPGVQDVSMQLLEWRRLAAAYHRATADRADMEDLVRTPELDRADARCAASYAEFLAVSEAILAAPVRTLGDARAIAEVGWFWSDKDLDGRPTWGDEPGDHTDERHLVKLIAAVFALTGEPLVIASAT